MRESERAFLLFSDLALPTAGVDPRAEDLRREHFRLLQEAAADAGERVRILGDGLLVAFAEPVAALECAASVRTSAARRNRRSADEPLELRAAVHAGDPIHGEEDYLSSAVALVRRLCASASAGQVLVSDEVEELTGAEPAPGVTLTETDPVPLEADGKPVSVRELVAAPTIVSLPIPPELVSEPGPGVVGRPELEDLLRAWKDVMGGARRLVWVSGPTGIGKTTLAGALARRAHPDGGLVLYASAAGLDTVAGGTMVEALGPYVGACPPRILREHLRVAGEEALPTIVGEAPEPEPDAFVAFLSDMAIDAPVLLVLDDLHAADEVTLETVGRLVGDATGDVLVVGTFDPRRLLHDRPLARMLSDDDHDRIRLRGLDPDAVDTVVRSTLSSDAPARLVARLREATAGDPLHLEWALRVLEGGEAPEGRVPESAVEAAGHLLASLGSETLGVLTQAAVLGDRFPDDVLARMAGMDADTVRALLAPAVEAGFLAPCPSGHRFVHSVVAHALTGGLEHGGLAELHVRAARAVEDVGGPRIGLPQVPIEITSPPEMLRGEAEPGEEDASGEAALVQAEPEPEAEPGTRPDVEPAVEDEPGIVDLEVEEQRREVQGQVRERLLAHASTFPLRFDPEAAERDLQALSSVPSGSDGLTAGLDTLRAMIAAFDGSAEDGSSVARRAMNLAERSHQRETWTIASAVCGWHRWACGRLREGQNLLDRAWSSADELDDPVLAPLASRSDGAVRLMLLDLPGARAALMREVAKRRAPKGSMDRRFLVDALAAVGALSGRLEEARRLGGKAGLEDAESVAGPVVSFAEGLWEESERVWEASRDRRAAGWAVPWWSATMSARALRNLGRTDQAREVVTEALDGVVGSGVVPAELALRAELAIVCAELDDLEEAKSQLTRCRQILVQGEDWRGLEGRVNLARGYVDGLSSGPDAVTKPFERAVDAFRRFALPFDEGEALRLWARVLGSAERPEAATKREAAVHVYDACRAGPAWKELVQAEAPEGASAAG